jgi:hypothetical protein
VALEGGIVVAHNCSTKSGNSITVSRRDCYDRKPLLEASHLFGSIWVRSIQLGGTLGLAHQFRKNGGRRKRHSLSFAPPASCGI